MKKIKYSEPVNTLLTFGELSYPGDDWFDYLKLGLSKEHIPELITMLKDDSLHRAEAATDEVWAPVHAWRTLGQLQAVEAIPALLDQLYRIEEHNDDWVLEELPEVFAMIGAPAIPGLTQYLGDSQHWVSARICAAHSLTNIGKLHTETRQRCITGLEEQLKRYLDNDPSINGFLVGYLLDLKAVEALTTIQHAYQHDCVDLIITGDCEDAEIELGVRDVRSTPRPRLWPFGNNDIIDPPPFVTSSPSEQASIRIGKKKVGRNDPCPCGSGKKYKKCCLGKEDTGIEKSHTDSIPKCGLCGKTTNLTKTPCCDQWICDDEANYKLFSYERNSCYRNHSRYTLCGNHYVNNHTGHWKDCEECKEDVETELYVYYGTNEYNFEKLKNPPTFKPTKCVKCGTRIHLGQEGYSVKEGKYWCARCAERYSIFS